MVVEGMLDPLRSQLELALHLEPVQHWAQEFLIDPVQHLRSRQDPGIMYAPRPSDINI